jgi:hypothetical protein
MAARRDAEPACETAVWREDDSVESMDVDWVADSAGSKGLGPAAYSAARSG